MTVSFYTHTHTHTHLFLYGLWNASLSAVAGALFDLNTHCGPGFPFRQKGHKSPGLCPICPVKVKLLTVSLQIHHRHISDSVFYPVHQLARYIKGSLSYPNSPSVTHVTSLCLTACTWSRMFQVCDHFLMPDYCRSNSPNLNIFNVLVYEAQYVYGIFP